MKYKNPRLKHVKKIRDMAYEIGVHNWKLVANLILDQCNLLLETKKVKRCERCAKGFTCYLHGAYPVRPEPSPQPDTRFSTAGMRASARIVQLKKLDRNVIEKIVTEEMVANGIVPKEFHISPQPEIEYPWRDIAMSPLEESWFDTLTALVKRVNKLSNPL